MSPIIFSGCSDDYIFLDNGYEDDLILQAHANGQIQELIGILNSPVPVMNESRLWGSALLPSIVSSLILKADQLVVVDFGGGAGKQFAEIIRTIDDQALIAKIQYHLIETPKLCGAIESDLSQIFQPIWISSFYLSSNIEVKKTDIVSCTSSLQYVADYEQKIKELLATAPEFFLIINTPVNNKYTYCRYQHNLAVKIVQWVFCLSNLDRIFQEHGYSRVFFSTHQQDHRATETPNNSATLQASLIYQKM